MLSDRWQRNSTAFAQKMRQLDAQLKGEFATLLQARGYLVLHDAYGHFERHYGVQRVATWAATPEQQPGARHLLELQTQIQNGVIGCVFTEPQFEPRALETLTGKRQLQRRQLDLMASVAPLTAEGFESFFDGFGRAFVDCLRP